MGERRVEGEGQDKRGKTCALSAALLFSHNHPNIPGVPS
jgi:hypothetical protein